MKIAEELVLIAPPPTNEPSYDLTVEGIDEFTKETFVKTMGEDVTIPGQFTKTQFKTDTAVEINGASVVSLHKTRVEVEEQLSRKDLVVTFAPA